MLIKENLDKPRRFKLKGGQEIFGVIWERDLIGSKEYFFATLNEYNSCQNLNGGVAKELLAVSQKIDIKKVIAANPIK